VTVTENNSILRGATTKLTKNGTKEQLIMDKSHNCEAIEAFISPIYHLFDSCREKSGHTSES
jgi:hypothetical protein